MFSQHALHRMQQRGIRNVDVEHLLAFGKSSFHRGREIVFLDRRAWNRLTASGELAPADCDRLRNQYLVMMQGNVVTVAHKTRHFKRDRH